MNEPKKKRRLIDILLPIVEDGKPAPAGSKTESTEAPVQPQQKKRVVPGSENQSTDIPISPSMVILPSNTNPQEDVFYKNILERVEGVGSEYDHFQKLLSQFAPMFPGADDKAVAAAVIAMGENGANKLSAAIDEKLGTLVELSNAFVEETKASVADLEKQEKSLPSVDGQVTDINQQITNLQKQVAEQVTTLQKRIDALNQQKQIIAKQVQEGRAKIASAKESFQAAIARAQKIFEATKSKISHT